VALSFREGGKNQKKIIGFEAKDELLTFEIAQTRDNERSHGFSLSKKQMNPYPPLITEYLSKEIYNEVRSKNKN
jgi:hypothetical protein